MVRANWIAGLLAVALLAGCAGKNVPYRVAVDEFQKTEMLSTGQVGWLDGTPALSLTMVSLSAHLRNFDGQDRMTMSVSVDSDGWVFIREGESLVFLLDGQRLALESPAGSSPYRKVITGKRIQEIAFYRVNAAQVRQVAAANEVRLRIYGASQTLDRSFSDSYHQAFDDFVKHVLEPRGL